MEQTAAGIQSALSGHWNGQFIQESTNRQQDSAVMCGLYVGCASAKQPFAAAAAALLSCVAKRSYNNDNFFGPSDGKVASTINTLSQARAMGRALHARSPLPPRMRVFAQTFNQAYAINQADTNAGVPGVLLGRYPVRRPPCRLRAGRERPC